MPEEKYPDFTREHAILQRLWSKLGDESFAGPREPLDEIVTVQDRMRHKWEDHYARMGLNVHGRAKTEARLRELYAQASEDEKGEIARFLFQWQSKRGLRVADDWMDEGPPIGAYGWILARYTICDGMQTADRFLAQLDRTDLDDGRRDRALDHFSDLIDRRQRHPRYGECLAVIASHLEHPSTEVRWTAAFSLGKLGAKEYRDELVALSSDTSKCMSGYVSAVARNAVRLIDGEPDVDLYDAEAP